ncbi:MAG: Fur family transcriptional regulator [Pseudomonadota bacterium]
MAAALCGDRGVQLTPLRQRILELLWNAERPSGAYDLVEALRNDGDRPVGPPTIYRALDFLKAQGLVSKIESRNSYVPCAHPERSHNCLFVICSHCGASDELEDARVEHLLAENAQAIGYRLERSVVEVQGICEECIASGASSATPEFRHD